MVEETDGSAVKQDFAWTEGDDNTISITKEDDAGNPEDITGWTFWLTLKENRRDSDSDAVLQKEVTSHVDAANGKTEFVLSNTETSSLEGTYQYDMQYKTSAGDITTFLRGTMYFDGEVTEAT